MSAWVRKEEIGGATLYLGDRAEIAPLLGETDHHISDPPYGDEETHKTHLSTTTLRNGEPARQALGFEGLDETACVELTREWCASAQGWVVFTCEWKYMRALHDDGTLVRFGIWRKRNGAPQFTGDRPGTGWEGIAICHRRVRACGGGRRKVWNGGGRHAFWDIPKEVGAPHPTQKPLALYESFVSLFTQPGDEIRDEFMGSGTTGVAALGLGRRFVGIERDPRWFDLACTRIDAVARQGRLFA